ncbi:MAG: hypothetical protein ACTSV7_13535 [Candidatus Baldrarchaeia archaeon]
MREKFLNFSLLSPKMDRKFILIALTFVGSNLTTFLVSKTLFEVPPKEAAIEVTKLYYSRINSTSYKVTLTFHNYAGDVLYVQQGLLGIFGAFRTPDGRICCEHFFGEGFCIHPCGWFNVSFICSRNCTIVGEGYMEIFLEFPRRRISFKVPSIKNESGVISLTNFTHACALGGRPRDVFIYNP